MDAFDWVRDDIEIKFRDNGDIDYGRFLLERMDTLNRLEKALRSVEEEYDSIREDLGLTNEVRSDQKEDNLRLLRVSVTENAVKQSLLSLTGPKKQGLVEVGERMTIHTPVGKPFSTRIGKVGNRLEERGRIRAFYKEYKIEDEDVVILEEIEPKVWKLYVDEARREHEAKVFKQMLEDL